MAFDRHAVFVWSPAMYWIDNPATPEEIEGNDYLLTLLAMPFPSPDVLLDIYTVNYCTDFPPSTDGKLTTKLACLPSSTLPSPRMDGCLAKEQDDAPSVGVAKEKSKADIPCGTFAFGRLHYCRHRLCPQCSRFRHYYMRSNLAEHVSTRPADRIYSLGLATVPATCSLGQQLTALYASFRQLRRRVAWNTIIGGAWFLDLTYNATAQHWHPHLHLIVEAEGFNVSDIQHRWLKLTGGSVYHSPLTPTADDTDRLTAYHTLPPHLKDGAKGKTFATISSLRQEYAVAVKGKQLYRCFGSWNGLKLLERRR